LTCERAPEKSTHGVSGFEQSFASLPVVETNTRLLVAMAGAEVRRASRANAERAGAALKGCMRRLLS
jgi:hypothetical protein